MDSTGDSTPLGSFKSEKALPSSVVTPHSANVALGAPDQIPLHTKTPENTHPPTTPLTRRKALVTVHQVREAAKQLLKLDPNLPVFFDPITKTNTFEAIPEKHVSGRRSITSDTPVKKKRPASSGNDVSFYLSKETRQAIEEEKAKARKRRITLLPKLYSRIYHFFVVNKRSVIPKEEFMECRGIFQHLGIGDDYADEYLGLLEEPVPDWIYEKYSSGGVLLVCINKEVSGSVRQRLSEAK